MSPTNQKCIVNTHKEWELELNILKKALKPQGKKARDEERNREEIQKWPEKINKMAVSTCLSITTLNVNAINSPIKT